MGDETNGWMLVMACDTVIDLYQRVNVIYRLKNNTGDVGEEVLNQALYDHAIQVIKCDMLDDLPISSTVHNRCSHWKVMVFRYYGWSKQTS